MSVVVVTTKVEIHTTPLEEVIVSGPQVTIKFDDVNEIRWKISFKPYQGIKITTVDCASRDLFSVEGQYPRYLLENLNSQWIKELSTILEEVDHTADFIQKSHHYVLPFQDNIVEVIAWDNFTLELDN